MKLFSKDGCLTDEGLQALIHEELDEMSRLEAAEHLDFCDKCVERYSEMLTADLEIAPPEELSPAILQRIRRKVRMLFVNRFTQVSVAAVLALVLWGGLYHNGILIPTDDRMEQMTTATQFLQGKFSGWNDRLDALMSDFNSFLNKPRSPGQTHDNAAERPAEQKG